jgi:hypothetical protein
VDTEGDIALFSRGFTEARLFGCPRPLTTGLEARFSLQTIKDVCFIFWDTPANARTASMSLASGGYNTRSNTTFVGVRRATELEKKLLTIFRVAGNRAIASFMEGPIHVTS